MACRLSYGTVPVVAAVLVLVVFCAGCTVQITPGGGPVPATPDPSRSPVATADTTALPVSTAPPVQPATTAPPPQTTGPALKTAELPYGVTITYPPDWMLEETGVNVTRDYGRKVHNIANLFSPAIPSGSRMPGPNPDRSQHTILTIDVDEAPGADFEDYFNRVPLSLRKEYGAIGITSHDLQLRVSGFKAYMLDFDAAELRGKYIFTRAGGRVYIFAFTNPSPHSSEVEALYRSIVISP